MTGIATEIITDTIATMIVTTSTENTGTIATMTVIMIATGTAITVTIAANQMFLP